jgi:hypothetical protein
MGRDEACAMALLAAVVVSQGVAWPMLKLGVAQAPPAWFGGWRTLIGCVVLFAIASATGHAGGPGRADLPVVLSVGLLQMAAPTALLPLAVWWEGAPRLRRRRRLGRSSLTSAWWRPPSAAGVPSGPSAGCRR